MSRMKSKKKGMIGFIVFVLCIVGIIFFKNFFKKETEGIMKKGEYTTGTVLVFSSSKPTIHTSKTVNQPGQAQSIKFEYFVNGKKYIHTYGGNKGYVPDKGVKIGQKYLIKYLKINPQKSRILFDFPVKDSVDFIRYLEKFEKIQTNK